MRRLYYSNRIKIVRGLPAYADRWRIGGKLPFVAIKRAPKGGGIHILVLGFCLGIKLA